MYLKLTFQTYEKYKVHVSSQGCGSLNYSNSVSVEIICRLTSTFRGSFSFCCPHHLVLMITSDVICLIETGHYHRHTIELWTPKSKKEKACKKASSQEGSKNQVQSKLDTRHVSFRWLVHFLCCQLYTHIHVPSLPSLYTQIHTHMHSIVQHFLKAQNRSMTMICNVTLRQ